MANPSLQIGNDNWAIKEDNLLGYSTAGTRFVPQPITMTRATLGTRVNPSGLVENVELLGSELVTCGDFSCATPSTYWTAINAVISFDNNQLTVDDTAGAGGDSRGSQTITTENGKTYRLTFNRISTTSLFYLGVGSGAGYNNIFYSSLGTDTGEYTLDFTATSSSTTIAFISGGNGITVFSNISVKEATIDNLPRVDYTDGTSSLLVEPQRTNLVTYSEDFEGSGWSHFRGTITPNSIISPDGTLNASRYEEDIQTGAHMFRRQSLSLTNGLSYTGSIFAKKGELTSISLQSNSSSRWVASATFDLENGLVTSGTGIIENYQNDWYKCSISGNAVQTTSDAGLEILTSSGVGRTGDGLYMWGAQFEEGSYPTSYIKTSGSTVTRNQETYTKTGISDKINSEEGVLFLEMTALSNDGTSRCISIFQNGSNFIKFIYSASSNRVDFVAFSDGNVSCNITKVISNTTENTKFGLKWKVNDFALWIDGTEVGTDLSGDAPLGMDKMYFTDEGGSGNKFFGKVKQLQVFKTALTDSELATLTT
jgi:hypothetical protein